jgi:AraC family transcriptional regulator
LGASHDDPQVTPPDKIRYDCCVTVGDEFQPEGDVGVQTLGGGECAVAIHHGPYERLAETYAEICGRWAPSSGRELGSAPCLEFYLNDPGSTSPEDLRTKVCVPLEAK